MLALILLSFPVLTTVLAQQLLEPVRQEGFAGPAGGAPRSGVDSLDACIADCQNTQGCWALHYGALDASCVHYDAEQVCEEPQEMEGMTYVALVLCSPRQHRMTGAFHSFPVTASACVESCVSRAGVCTGADHDRGACWHHTGPPRCDRQLTPKDSCSHYRVAPCAGFPGVKDVKRDQHAHGGRLMGFRDVEGCLGGCQLPACKAADFNHADKSCWYHGAASVCAATNSKTSCDHYIKEDCDETRPQPTKTFEEYHALNGEFAPAPRSLESCLRVCADEEDCTAVGFDSRGRNCFLFNATTACRPLYHMDDHVHALLQPCVDLPSHQCGQPFLKRRALTERIVGGIETPENSFPWQVGVFYESEDTGQLEFICGGSLISDRAIVTAAHCVPDATSRANPSRYYVAVGIHDIFAESKKYPVINIAVHEDYNADNNDLDVAVLTLGKSLDFSIEVLNICLPSEEQLIQPGITCTVTGWGVQTSGSSQLSQILRQADVLIIEQQLCNSALYYNTTITDNMICAGLQPAGGADTCQGDSGGPLQCQLQGRWFLAGITSFGRGCGEAHSPGVYTRVTAIAPWIQERLLEAKAAPVLAGEAGDEVEEDNNVDEDEDEEVER